MRRIHRRSQGGSHSIRSCDLHEAPPAPLACFLVLRIALEIHEALHRQPIRNGAAALESWFGDFGFWERNDGIGDLVFAHRGEGGGLVVVRVVGGEEFDEAVAVVVFVNGFVVVGGLGGRRLLIVFVIRKVHEVRAAPGRKTAGASWDALSATFSSLQDGQCIGAVHASVTSGRGGTCSSGIFALEEMRCGGSGREFGNRVSPF
jgi:hypothetical protein